MLRGLTIIFTFVYLLIAAAHQDQRCSPDSPNNQLLLWKEISTTRVTDVKLAVLPLGSIEGHGPHLPLGTDLILAEAIVNKASENLEGVAVLPASPYGASFEHESFDGTIPVQDMHLNGLWDDVLSAVIKSGISRIVVVNAHGGQTSNVDLAVRKCRFRDNALVVSFNIQAMMAQAWRRVEKRADQLAAESVHGIHGGLIETSVMLHLYPGLVDVDRLANFAPLWDTAAQHLEPHGPIVAYGWRSEDLSESGALGDASSGNAEIGNAIFAETVQKLRGLLTDVRQASHEELLFPQ